MRYLQSIDSITPSALNPDNSLELSAAQMQEVRSCAGERGSKAQSGTRVNAGYAFAAACLLIASIFTSGCAERVVAAAQSSTASSPSSPSAPSAPPAAPAALKVFSVVRSSDPASALDDSISSQCTAGITLYFGWEKIEPQPGVFDFSGVISAINKAQSGGKLVNLAILPGMWSPQFVLNNPAIQQMTYTVQDPYTGTGAPYLASSPVPWDANYQASLIDMIQHLAKSLAGVQLNSIAVTGGSNVNGLEMLLVGTDAELQTVGFSAEKYENAWEQDVDAYAAAFPNTPLTIAVHDQYGSQVRYDISQDVLKYSMQKYGNTIYPQSDAFTGQSWFNPSNAYADLVLGNDINGRIGLQELDMYANSSDEQGFQQMVTQANVYNPAWLEIWSADLEAYGCS
jgi:hypothetical protein